MITVKKERLEDLENLGFWTDEDGDYIRSLKVSNINVSSTYGTFYVSIQERVFDDFISEITRISNQLIADRHEVDIMTDILREKGMLEDE